MSVRASRRLMILLPHPAQCIRWYARTRTPTDACSISAVAGMPIWSDLNLLILRRYSTSFGVSLIDRNLHGSKPGASAISSCGIIAAPCTDAMHSTRIRAASCTAPKSRGSNDRRKRGAEGCMRRREFITFLGGAASWPLAARAQQTKIARLGFVSWQDPTRIEDLRQGLRELGYVEGKNIEIEVHFVDGNRERTQNAIRRLVQKGVDILVVRATPAAHIAKAMTQTIPS